MENDKLVLVIGYPKSGNTWVSRLMGDILDSPVVGYMNASPIATEGQNRTGEYKIMQLHMHLVYENYTSSMPNAQKFCGNHWNGEKIIHVIRDPRDVAVSAMYYWGLQDLKTTINAMAEGIFPLKVHGNWGKFVDNWTAAKFPKKNLFYETLLSDTESTVELLLNYFEIKHIQKERIKEAIERQSFVKKRASIEINGDELMYGKEVQLRNMRKGISGDWKNHFTRLDGILLNGYFGDHLSKYGFENEYGWWSSLPDRR